MCAIIIFGTALGMKGMSDVKIMIWDHNRGIMYQRAQIAYGDPEASKYIGELLFIGTREAILIMYEWFMMRFRIRNSCIPRPAWRFLVIGPLSCEEYDQ